MSTSAAAHKHDWRSNERRSSRREPLRWIVLVFFGQNNWGKLIDLSEKGMCFQFEQTPSVKEPIEFTFEAMGCMSIPHEANVFGDSFQAAGRVVWTHDFERTAGVQFLNLSQRSRDQIRYWLSAAAEQGAAAPPEALNVGHTAGLTEELRREWDAEWNRQQSGQQAPAPFVSKVRPAALPKTPAEPIHEASEPELEEVDSHLEWQPEPPFRPQTLSPHAELHREPELAVPVLAQALKNDDWIIRDNAAAALGRFGGQAKSAVPELTKALQDSNGDVRRQAASALKRINSNAPPR